MLKFSDYHDNELHELNIFKWISGKFSEIGKVTRSLKLGQSKKVSFNMRNLSEAGAWKSTVMGVYAEKWAVYSFAKEMKDNKFALVGDVNRLKAEAEHYGKLIFQATVDGVSHKGSKLLPSEIETAPKELPGYKEKGIALGKRSFLDDVLPDADSRYCYYEIEHTGGSESLNSTADMVIRKFSQSEMKEEYRYSLKAYLSDGSKTRGTQKDPFGILGEMIGVSNVTAKSVHKHDMKFAKAFGDEVAIMAKKSAALQKFYLDEAKKLKSLGDKDSVNKAKLLVAKKYGGEIIDIQIGYWVKCFEIAAKSHPKEFAEEVLKLLDMRKDSPVLMTAGMDKKGQVTSFKNSSPEIRKLMNTDSKDVEVSIKGNMRPVKAALQPYIDQPTVFNSNMMIAFSVEGVELYRVSSQVWISGVAQFMAKAGNLKTKATIESSISEQLDGKKNAVTDRKAMQLAEKMNKRRPKTVPLPKVVAKFAISKEEMKKNKAAIRKIQSYLSKEGLDIEKVTKKMAIDVLDLVANRRYTPEQAFIEYEHLL